MYVPKAPPKAAALCLLLLIGGALAPLSAQDGFLAPVLPNLTDNLLMLLTFAPVQVLLIVVGLVMLFVEANTPGFGISGIAAAGCFIAVFGSNALLGRVESLELVLFLIGVALLSVEIFVTPGFGVLGVAGFLAIGGALVFSMQDFILPRSGGDWSLLGRNAAVVLIGMIAAITAIALLALLGPRLRLFDALTLKSAIRGTAGGVDPDSAAEKEGDVSLLTGKVGSAFSTLRPSGKALIDDHVYPVEADGMFIEEGELITVTTVNGNRILVRKV
jgi:membrane-bound serine protease (ClpP class)